MIKRRKTARGDLSLADCSQSAAVGGSQQEANGGGFGAETDFSSGQEGLATKAQFKSEMLPTGEGCKNAHKSAVGMESSLALMGTLTERTRKCTVI